MPENISEKRRSLLAAYDRAAAAASGFHALQGAGWGLRLRRAAALGPRYLRYLVDRFVLADAAKARVFWGKSYRWGRPEHSSSMFFFGVLEHSAEVRLTRYLIRTLPDDAVFFDIGANFGFYSLLAAELSGNVKIRAFEPVPYVFASLEKNLAGLPGAEAVNAAVSERVGEVSFDQAPESRHTGSSLDEEGSREPGAERFAFTKITVRSTTVDAFVAESGLVPTVMKIDVEGAEKLVVEGARKTLASASPAVILEVWKPPVQNRNHREAARLLQELGYRAHALTESGEARFLDEAALDAEFSGGESANLVFLKR